MRVLLHNNQFAPMVTDQPQEWDHARYFDASNNAIAQDVVQIGKLHKDLWYINLRGNAIKAVKSQNGRVVRAKKVHFDNGVPAQRDPAVEAWVRHELKYFP